MKKPGNYNVLIIDDEKLISTSLKRTIEHDESYAVDCTFSGAEGLKALAGDGYDVVLTDLSLPDYKYFDILSGIRELNPSVPLIIMSGFCSELTEDDLSRFSIFRCLNKPFDLEDLVEAVGEAVR